MQGDLSERYHGRRHREVPAPDPELTAVGPGTPCGELLRAAWQPVCLSSQLGDRPLGIRILGEDLVALRDGGGAVGVLHRHCSHRGASLEFGRIMPRGIACCYHGWHYDLDGTILDTPAEPPSSRLRQTLRQGAYPAVERHGLVFAWLGDPAAVPPPPVLDVEEDAATRLVPFLLEIPCNWLQVYENSQDPVHVVWLHARNAGAHFDASNEAEQELDFVATPLGMMNVQTRRWGGMVWTRTVECILPNLNQTGAIWEDAAAEKAFQRVGMTRWVVPVDDTHSLQIGWRHLGPHLDPKGRDRPEAIGLHAIDFEGQDASASYADRQRRPGDYDAQVSQRPIAVHAKEHLASSDRGVAMLRRQLRRAVRGETPLPAGARLATFCQDTVTALPQIADDRALLRAHGAAVARAVLNSAGLPSAARRDAISAAARGVSLHPEETPR